MNPRPHPSFLAALVAVLLAGSASAQWPQWGGEDRSFHSSATGLADAWPETGPRKIWERPLGAGFSSIVVDGEQVFTMYRSPEDEVIVALDARTGKTVWEHRDPTAGSEPPNSTPLVQGERLYALGVTGRLSALEKRSGKLVWSHDLVEEYGVKRPQYGFSASPLAHGGALILPLGGAGYGVAAFALEDGELLWHALDLEEFYASPVLIQVEGEPQVVVLGSGQLVGLNPATGQRLWSESVGGDQNISTPIWGSDGLLCVTACPEGSVGMRFSKVDGKTRVERVWKNEALLICQTTVVRVGDFLYGSTGDPSCVTAVRAATGEIVWREEGLSVANALGADGKVLWLDYEGVLGLASARSGAWELTSRVALLEREAFTTPTLADRSLYLRDQKRIVALDLGEPDGSDALGRGER